MKLTKKILLIIAPILIIVIGLGIFFFLKNKNVDEDFEQEESVDIPYDYGIYYKDKKYSSTALLNRDAVNKFTKSLLPDSSPNSDLNYKELMKLKDGCDGNIKFGNGSYKFSSTCNDDNKDELHVEYAINYSKNTSIWEKEKTYHTIDNNDIVITNTLSFEKKNKSGEQVTVVKINSDGTQAWEKEFDDYIKPIDDYEKEEYKYSYLGLLSNDEYDVLIFDYFNEYYKDKEHDEADGMVSDLIIYKVNKKGETIERKTINDVVGYTKVYNNKFYYMIADDDHAFTIKVIDNAGNISIHNKVKDHTPDKFDVNGDNLYFIDYNDIVNECFIEILDKNNTFRKIDASSVEIKENIDTFKYYNNNLFVITYDGDVYFLYIIDSNGKLVQKEKLLPKSKTYYNSFIGFYVDNTGINIYYYSLGDDDNERDGVSRYDYVYNLKYDNNLSKSVDKFYIDYGSYLFLGKNKYSIYPTFYNDEYKYYTVEINK